MNYVQYAGLTFINFELILLILIGALILGLILCFVSCEPDFMGIPMIPAIIIIVICSILSFNYDNLITYKTVTENKQIAIRPYEYMDNETYTFIVDNKEFTTIRTSETKYFNDKPSQPYIIVEKVTYHAPYRFYMNKSSIDAVNNTAKYVLKEVHY